MAQIDLLLELAFRIFVVLIDKEGYDPNPSQLAERAYFLADCFIRERDKYVDSTDSTTAHISKS